MTHYSPQELEPKWQAAWTEAGTFRAEISDAPKYYVLEMFPYPSGRIHMGHVRNYTMGDVIARYKIAQGFNVLHPMGWDAFGMPAENAAMERGGHPKDWTYGNIADMRAQMKPLGLSIDWSREFATCDPEYYGQQQALFLDFLERGLVYRKSATVNWDPVDMTVLANEQVIDGKGWRSGAVVERRELTQWFFKISDYSEELLEAIDRLDDWPEKVKLMQRNWIGKSRGLQFEWSLTEPAGGVETIDVYTTRPDTLMGASFIGVSPDHPLAKALEADNPELAAFNAECRRMGTAAEELEKAEKLGFDTGLTCRHPLDPEWELPVWVANFILMDYGTGAIFGCPAHDQRDLDFCRKYGLPVIDTFVALDNPQSVETVAFVPPKTERVRWINHFAGSTRRPAKKRSTPQSRWPSVTAGARASRSSGCATGGSRGSATGAARSRSCIATPAVWCPRKKRTSPSGCRTMSVSTPPAIRSTGTPAGSRCPARNAATGPGAKPTRWTPSWTRPGISRGSRQPHAETRRPRWRRPPTG